MQNLNNEQLAKLEKLFERRRAKEPLIRLLALANTSKNGPDRVSTAKAQSYSNIVAQLAKCVKNKLLTESEIADVIGDLEIAGNQHVMLFEMPSKSKNAKAVWDNMIAPRHQSTNKIKIEEYLEFPDTSNCHVINQSDDQVTIKFVTERNYWLVNELSEGATLDRRLFERIRQRERSAITLKTNRNEGLVQVRVPPTEKGGDGSGRSHFEFACSTFEKFYKDNWFSAFESLKITDAFPTLVNDKKTLVSLSGDSPKNDSVASRIKNRGRPSVSDDLRKKKDWGFSSGYARDYLSGFFQCAGETSQRKALYARLHSDRLRGDGISIARLFVPHACTDEELEYVIAKIREHI